MENVLFKLLKEMFDEMVIKKDASLVPHYYHEDFAMVSNEVTMDYTEFLKKHEEIYETPIPKTPQDARLWQTVLCQVKRSESNNSPLL